VLFRSLLQEYDDNGFVVTPDVLSDDELARYSAAVDAEVSKRTLHDTRAMQDKSTYEQSFIQCMRLWETSDAVLPLTCHAGLAGVAAQLMHVDGVRLWQDQALYKEPGGRETTAHQDQTFWPIGTEPLVSAWIPFDDVTLDNGAMAYVPGSHKAGRLRAVDITHSTDPYEILQDPALNGAQPHVVEVPAGAVVWHHGLTVHQAAANETSDSRRVFTIVYIAAHATRSKAWPAYPLDRDEVAVGETIQGPGMPLLWPPSDKLPVPPPAVSVAVGPQH
jgi:ectoine hydroxylase-related dioxygenase (phytanoyl-CoA dioxygenase family)